MALDGEITSADFQIDGTDDQGVSTTETPPDQKPIKPIPPRGEHGHFVSQKPEPEPEKAEPETPEPVKEAPEGEAPEGDEPLPEAAKAEGEPEETEEQKATRKGNPRHDPKARMLQATQQLAQERREREQERREWQARVEAIERRLQPPQQQQQARPSQDEAPKREDFATDEEFFNAYVDKRAEAKSREMLGAERQRQEQQARVGSFQRAMDAKLKKLNESMAQAAQEIPDFKDRISADVLDLEPSFMLQGTRPTAWNAIADEIIDSSDAPRLMLHLSEHPDELRRLATLTPRSLVREMAKLETKLERAAPTGSPAPRAQSKAKPPVHPVTGSPQAEDPNVLSDDLPATEWLKRAASARKIRLPR